MRPLIRKFYRIIQTNDLFFKVFLVMVVSIISVSIVISYSTIQVSQNLFMDTFTITNTKVLNQMKSRLEAYSYAVVNTVNSMQTNGTIKRVLMEEQLNSIETAKLYYEMTKQMESVYTEVASYGANMIVIGKNSRLFNMNYSNWPVTWEELQHHAVTTEALQSPNQLLIQSTSENGEPMIVAAKVLLERSTENRYGIVYISIRERQLREFYEGYTTEGNKILIVNDEGQIISSNDQTMIGVTDQALLHVSREMSELGLEYTDVHVFDKDYMILSEYLPTFNMYLINLVDKRMISENLLSKKEIYFIIIGIIVLSVFIIFILLRRMTKSLTNVVEQISNMAKYHFKRPLVASGGYETEQIANAFNDMLRELQEYVDLVVETEQKQRKAELKALQHQINPHFLYNTLTSVKFMVQQGDKEKAAETILALITLLQNALGHINETITVEQELTIIKKYVLINQARYGERIKVHYFVSPECLPYQMPKLVLQPFIENAFFHAFNKKKEGFIQVMAAVKDEKLLFEIVDNGDGMDLEKVSLSSRYHGKRQLFHGIGVRNVHERIQLLYGKDYGVEMTSNIGNGTVVHVILPLLTNELSKKSTIF
ncbi:cache domain-containing sensor histidine kinase [Halalkalibacterium halodurans]|uniref:cache domain-containing sensor histidine kinase n=1 Tax=Halalkalibacterium halodurans TaxID=86665 RepID=UPI0006A99DE0|nr:sensor histidine kinase [Halalkalibacterium halodurans]TPE69414.1 sensor histidine kinase [Halalkalibacterium halodurans]